MLLLGHDNLLFYSTVLTHIVKTCGTVAIKTTKETLFGIEFFGECYVFPGLNVSQLELVSAADPVIGCYYGVGSTYYVKIFSFE